MKKAIIAGLVLAGFATAAVAGVITDRQNIMKGLDTANKTLRTMTTPTPPTNPNAPPIAYVAFDAKATKAQLQIIVDSIAKIPGMFPAGSDVAAGTETPHANPVAFTDSAGLIAAAGKLSTDAKAAMAATDQVSFTAAWTTMNSDCNACHMTYRARPQRPAGAGGPGGAPGAGAPAAAP